MTKAELIRKLARKTGVPDSEAKGFFEIFLQQLSGLLSPGEAIDIKGLGFFQLRKGKVKDVNQPVSEDVKSEIYSDLIVFSTSLKEADNSNEVLIFNVPAAKTIQHNLVDSYFSLSAGKPVIPLRGVKNTEFFIPPTGTELRRLLETKAENLVSASDLVKNYAKGSEYLFISPDSYNANQFEMSWSELLQKEESAAGRESIPWDFGEDISRQIEEESILDIEKDEIAPPVIENESVSWDFGSDYFEEHTGLEKEKSEELAKKDQQELDDLKNFKRVKSFTKEHTPKKSPGLITRSEQNLSWNFGEEEKAPDENKDDEFYKSHYANAVTDEKGFTEVVNKRKTYDIELSSRDQARLDSIIKEELHKDDEHDAEDVTKGFYKEEQKAEPKLETIVSSYEREYYSGRRSTAVFIIALLVIIAVGGALFMYLKEGSLFVKKEGQQEVLISKPLAPVVINRSYDIPVTYPYEKNDDVSGISLPAAKTTNPVPIEPDQKRETTQPKAAEPKSNKPESAKPEPSKTESTVRNAQAGSVKIKNNLFKEGNSYSVQISSWKSKSKADMEVQKLRNKGLNAFVERAEVPGKGYWYRVKIGNFKTQSEAEKYLIE